MCHVIIQAERAAQHTARSGHLVLRLEGLPLHPVHRLQLLEECRLRCQRRLLCGPGASKPSRVQSSRGAECERQKARGRSPQEQPHSSSSRCTKSCSCSLSELTSVALNLHPGGNVPNQPWTAPGRSLTNCVISQTESWKAGRREKDAESRLLTCFRQARAGPRAAWRRSRLAGLRSIGVKRAAVQTSAHRVPLGRTL